MEYINVLTWKPNPLNLNVDKYRIYLEQEEDWYVLTVLPGTSLVYWHRKIDENLSYSYSITALDSGGKESAASTTSVGIRNEIREKEKKSVRLYRKDLTWILTLRMLF